MLDKIKTYAKNNSLIYGIGSANEFKNLDKILAKIEVPFVTATIEERTNPKLILPTAKSIICLGLSYNKKFVSDNTTLNQDNIPRGNISVGAVGEDYHITLTNHLKQLCSILGIPPLVFTDTGNLVDREVAIRCGLGKIGKHFSVINPEIGSMFFIGYIITDLELPKTLIDETFDPCISCDRCIKSCPAKAITPNGFNYKPCISYLTQAKEVPEEYFSIMGKQIYGCDICQRVCPYNSKPTIINCDIDSYKPSLEFILSMSNKIFAEKFKSTSAGWRGKKTLQRNSIIALSNLRPEIALPILEKYKSDPRPDIKDLINRVIEMLKNQNY